MVIWFTEFFVYSPHNRRINPSGAVGYAGYHSFIAYFVSIWHFLRILKPSTTEVCDFLWKYETVVWLKISMEIEQSKLPPREENEISLFRKNSQAYRNANNQTRRYRSPLSAAATLSTRHGICLLHCLILAPRVKLSSPRCHLFQRDVYVGFFRPIHPSVPTPMISSGLAGARRLLDVMNAENNWDENIQGHVDRINARWS
jgi:ATP-binding cassette subfamily B protein